MDNASPTTLHPAPCATGFDWGAIGAAHQFDKEACLHRFVELIHRDLYQPLYRRKPIATIAVVGWPDRLRAYFWPDPRYGLERNSETLAPIMHEARPLALIVEKKQPWTPDQERQAVQLAEDIFNWGGVRQRAPWSARDVRHVLENALAGRTLFPAPMNSGWTKVASIATAHLEEATGHPQAICDSRVCWSLTRGLDQILFAGGLEMGGNLFPSVGYIPGRGGSRGGKPLGQRLSLKWPNIYQKWSGHFAVSAAVRRIRDILNGNLARYGMMPQTDGRLGPWTVRGVEMVLFMDGY